MEGGIGIALLLIIVVAVVVIGVMMGGGGIIGSTARGRKGRGGRPEHTRVEPDPEGEQFIGVADEEERGVRR